jgi:hypothetical protein
MSEALISNQISAHAHISELLAEKLAGIAEATRLWNLASRESRLKAVEMSGQSAAAFNRFVRSLGYVTRSVYEAQQQRNGSPSQQDQRKHVLTLSTH